MRTGVMNPWPVRAAGLLDEILRAQADGTQIWIRPSRPVQNALEFSVTLYGWSSAEYAPEIEVTESAPLHPAVSSLPGVDSAQELALAHALSVRRFCLMCLDYPIAPSQLIASFQPLAPADAVSFPRLMARLADPAEPFGAWLGELETRLTAHGSTSTSPGVVAPTLLPSTVPCIRCAGIGYVKGETCPICRGTGSLEVVR